MAVAVGELWETAKHAIEAYTGLSPAAFFTVVALGLAVYHLVAGFFQPAAVPRTREMEVEKLEPLPPPVQLGEITEEELKVYDGTDPKKPLLMAIKAQIYDVTQSRMFYGPGGPYALFAGKDASRALAKMSFEANDLTGDISGLNPFELEALQDWEYKFMSKYVKVGTIKKTEGPSESTSDSTVTSLEETHSEETKDVNDAEAEHGAESKGDAPAEEGETKDNDLSGNDAKAEHSAESKDDVPVVKPGDDGKEAAKKGPVEVDLKDGGKKVTTSSIVAE